MMGDTTKVGDFVDSEPGGIQRRDCRERERKRSKPWLLRGRSRTAKKEEMEEERRKVSAAFKDGRQQEPTLNLQCRVVEREPPT